MTSRTELDQLVRQVRWLKIYCAVATGALTVFFLSGAASRNQFDELNVGRLNIIDSSGKIRLAISNKDRFPPPLLNGKSYQRAIVPAGLLFYDEAGNEIGGLAFANIGNGGASNMVFDYANADAVALVRRISPDEKDATAGLVINARPDPKLTASQAVKIQSQRVALQNHNETAELVLSDQEGRARLRLLVGPDGNPRIEMLNEKGEPVYSLPR